MSKYFLVLYATNIYRWRWCRQWIVGFLYLVRECHDEKFCNIIIIIIHNNSIKPFEWDIFYLKLSQTDRYLNKYLLNSICQLYFAILSSAYKASTDWLKFLNDGFFYCYFHCVYSVYIQLKGYFLYTYHSIEVEKSFITKLSIIYWIIIFNFK